MNILRQILIRPALSKILKEHDKKTSHNLRLIALRNPETKMNLRKTVTPFFTG